MSFPYRFVDCLLYTSLSLKLLEGDFPEGTEIVVREKDGKLDLSLIHI